MHARDELRDELLQQAFDAMRVARKFHSQWQSLVRVFARNPKLKLAFSAKMSATDGKTVWIKVPIELGQLPAHDKGECGKRDEHLVQRCQACQTLEEVVIKILHEVGHVLFNTFEPIPDNERERLLKDAIEAVCKNDPDDRRAKAIERKWNEAHAAGGGNFFQVSGAINSFLPVIINAVEDVRVNAATMKARPGTRTMFEALRYSEFGKGVQQADGSIKHWCEYPPNMQAIISIYLMGSGMNAGAWLDPDIFAVLSGDAEFMRLVNRVPSIQSCRQSYQLGFLLLDALRRLGFCRDEDDELEGMAPPMPPNKEPEKGDGGSSQDSDDPSESNDPSMGSGEADADDDSSDSDRGESSEGEGDSAGDPAGGETPDTGEGSEGPDASGDPEDGDESGDMGQGHGGTDQEGSGGGGEEATSDPPGSGDDNDPDRRGDFTEGDPDGDPSGGQDDSRGSAADEGDTGDADDAGGDDPSSGQGEGDADASDGSEPEGAPSPTDVDGSDTGHDGSDDPATDGPHHDPSPVDNGAETGDKVAPSPDSGTGWQEKWADYGSADEAAEALKQFGGHEDQQEPLTNAERNLLDDIVEAIEVAINQSEHFDKASHDIEGLRVHRWDERGQRLEDQDEGEYYYGRTAWEGSSDRETPLLLAPPTLIAPATNHLRLVFTGNKRGGQVPDLRKGRVNTRVLGRRVPAGDDRLFRRRLSPTRRDYGVVVGFDLSGSTAGGFARNEYGRRLTTTDSKLYVIKGAVCAKAEMLSRLGVKFCVYGHTGLYGVDMYEVKAWKEPWATGPKERLAALVPTGGNYDGHSLEFYRKQAEQIDATDRVILYYTDGAINNIGEEWEVFTENVRICQRLGITVVGVEIGVHSGLTESLGLPTVHLEGIEDIKKVVDHLERWMA